MDTNGLILTTSVALGNSPVVNVRLPSGEMVDGWVRGRYDPLGLALVKVQAVGLPVAELGDSKSLSVGSEVITLGFETGRPTKVAVAVTVIDAIRGDISSRATFMQLRTRTIPGMEGGPVMDVSGKVLGLLVPASVVEQAGIPLVRGGFTVPAEFLAGLMEELKAGLTNIRSTLALAPDSGQPPPLPLILQGTVMLRDTPAPAGIKLYIHVPPVENSEVWMVVEIGANGAYQVVVGLADGKYMGDTIEFWMDGLKSSTATTFRPGRTEVLNLSFP